MKLLEIPDKYFLLAVLFSAATVYLFTKDPIFGSLTRDLAVALIAIATGRGINSITTTNFAAKEND